MSPAIASDTDISTTVEAVSTIDFQSMIRLIIPSGLLLLPEEIQNIDQVKSHDKDEAVFRCKYLDKRRSQGE
jgi:hypothetical protein